MFNRANSFYNLLGCKYCFLPFTQSNFGHHIVIFFLLRFDKTLKTKGSKKYHLPISNLHYSLINMIKKTTMGILNCYLQFCVCNKIIRNANIILLIIHFWNPFLGYFLSVSRSRNDLSSPRGLKCRTPKSQGMSCNWQLSIVFKEKKISPPCALFIPPLTKPERARN